MNESVASLHHTHRDEHRHRHFFLLLIPSIVFALSLAFFLRNRMPAGTFKELAPRIETEKITVGSTEVVVRLAKSSEEQARGLSGVSNLPENEGMLFVFLGKARPPFWMKDMLIPLDFIWIADGKVSQLTENVPNPPERTTEADLKLYVSNDLIDHVLEVNSGFVKTHKIKIGDPVDLSSIN